jgi:hypothetical protein
MSIVTIFLSKAIRYSIRYLYKSDFRISVSQKLKTARRKAYFARNDCISPFSGFFLRIIDFRCRKFYLRIYIVRFNLTRRKLFDNNV